MLILALFSCILGLATSSTNESIELDKICVNRSHGPVIPGSHLRCCKNELLNPGISGNLEELWLIWETPPQDEQENITISTWTAYSSMLSQMWELENNTISFINFTDIMTASYPEKVGKEIFEVADEAYENDVTGNIKKLLTFRFPVTDFENLNRIRVAYYGMEQSVCDGKKYVPTPEIDMWNNCSVDTETTNRDGGCCRNNSIPFSDHFRNPYRTFEAQNCTTTLEKLLQKLKLSDPEDVKILVSEMTCRLSCFLVESGSVTQESLIGVKETDTFPVDAIVEILTPTYYSKSVRRYVLDFVKKYFNLKIVKKRTITPGENPLEGKVKKEDLLGCFGHDGIAVLVMHALNEYCNPEKGGILMNSDHPSMDLRFWKQ